MSDNGMYHRLEVRTTRKLRLKAVVHSDFVGGNSSYPRRCSTSTNHDYEERTVLVNVQRVWHSFH